MVKIAPRRIDESLPEFKNEKWGKIIGSSKTGYCDGRKIPSLKCNLYATLRPVYFAGKTIHLCGKCIAKLNKTQSKFTKPIPRY